MAQLRPMMARQVSHMVRLIDDLLDVSRITSGKVELQRETVTLGSLVDTAVEANRGAIAAAGLSLRIQLDEPERRLHVDPTRMSQVLSNILHNATKFTDTGGQITLSTHLAAGAQVFRITDTGVGIAEDLLPTIFELFTQIRPDSAKRHGGMGIGLALARSLVDLHGGTVTAESAGPGTGSTFIIRVPAASLTAQAARPPLQDAAARLAGLRILLVDDNMDAADALGYLLSAHGGEVRVTYLAETALDVLAAFSPHIVLLDIGLPHIDGYEACRRMRDMKGAGVRIVALTGWGQEEDRRRALEAGFDAHLTKPVDFDQLVEMAWPG
ncbi:MAG: ATP-binding protein [Aquabacterium sp.]